MCASIMIPAYRHSVSSVMPLDLNEDQNLELSGPTLHASYSFSSLSSSYPILFNPPNQEQEARSCYWKPTKHILSDEEAKKIIPTNGSSWDHSVVEGEQKVTVWKEEERNENDEAFAEDGSVRWMSSKMMVPDQTGACVTDNINTPKFDNQKQPLSPLGTDNSSNNYSKHNNNTVRVCDDCHTTKTPLWRSGPRGPKSLCNACGIRQRKARRAIMAAAAAASGSEEVVEAEKSVKGKLQKKEKKWRTDGAKQMKKKRKVGVEAKPSQSRNKFGLEDLTLRLRKNLAMHQVFPQDEKDAAILLMALSYGLVHG